jgi:hypothetical protein
MNQPKIDVWVKFLDLIHKKLKFQLLPVDEAKLVTATL